MAQEPVQAGRGVLCAVGKMPRVSDDNAADQCGSGYHLPGVWSKVSREQRARDAESVVRYLDDPRLVLVDGDDRAGAGACCS